MSSLIRALIGMRGVTVDGAALRSRFEARTVVVTGASRGVGRAVALRCAGAGAHVVLIARGGPDLEQVAAQVRAAGGVATTMTLDLRETDAATAAGERVVAAHGAPALVVSNAGHSIHRDLAGYTDRCHDVQRLAGVNLLGPIALAFPLLAAMRAAGAGQFISVGTVGAGLPGPGWSVYTATKAGLNAWLRSVGREIAGDRVALSAIHLPLVATAMSAQTSAWRAVPAAAAIARQWRVGDVRGLPAIWRHGATLAGLVLAAARSRPSAVLLVDDRGRVRGVELAAAVSRVGALIAAVGPHRRPAVAICAGSHRGFVAAVAATGILGLDAVVAGPHLGDRTLARLLGGVDVAVVDPVTATRVRSLAPQVQLPGSAAAAAGTARGSSRGGPGPAGRPAPGSARRRGDRSEFIAPGRRRIGTVAR